MKIKILCKFNWNELILNYNSLLFCYDNFKSNYTVIILKRKKSTSEPTQVPRRDPQIRRSRSGDLPNCRSLRKTKSEASHVVSLRTCKNRKLLLHILSNTKTLSNSGWMKVGLYDRKNNIFYKNFNFFFQKSEARLDCLNCWTPSKPKNFRYSLPSPRDFLLRK